MLFYTHRGSAGHKVDVNVWSTKKLFIGEISLEKHSAGSVSWLCNSEGKTRPVGSIITETNFSVLCLLGHHGIPKLDSRFLCGCHQKIRIYTQHI